MLWDPNPKTLAAEKIGRSYIYPQTTDFLILYSESYIIRHQQCHPSLFGCECIINCISHIYFRSFVGKYNIFLNCLFKWYGEKSFCRCKNEMGLNLIKTLAFFSRKTDTVIKAMDWYSLTEIPVSSNSTFKKSFDCRGKPLIKGVRAL